MSRHIIDKPENREKSHRTEEYIKHERKEMPSEATKQLHVLSLRGENPNIRWAYLRDFSVPGEVNPE